VLVERLVSGAALILGQLQDGLQEARTEADHATADQVCMAGDVATLFNELKALADRHAELHTDRARLEVDLEQAQRPWWRRLMGT
jgi:hypothetical protein